MAQLLACLECCPCLLRILSSGFLLVYLHMRLGDVQVCRAARVDIELLHDRFQLAWNKPFERLMHIDVCLIEVDLLTQLLS